MLFSSKNHVNSRNIGSNIIFNVNNSYNNSTSSVTQSDNVKTTKKIYSLIPLNLFQTWHTLDLPNDMKKNVDLLKFQNQEFKHFLYDDEMCRNFIKRQF